MGVQPTDPHQLSLFQLFSKVSRNALSGIDFLGSFLADTFGVTTHRYADQLDAAEQYEKEVEDFGQRMLKRNDSEFMRDELHDNEWKMSNQC